MSYFSVRIVGAILGIALSGAVEPAGAADLALVGGKIYVSPYEPPIDQGTIVIHDGTIRAVGPEAQVHPPADATTLDCRHLVVTAGFWNSHVHILTEGLMDAGKLPADRITSQLEEMLTRWGFTTVFDIASVLDNTVTIRRRIASGEVKGPRILTVGDPFYPKGGTPIYIKSFLQAHHVPSCEVESADQAVARVRRQIEHGADGAKIFAASFAGGGKIVPMPLDIAKAIVAEAHRAGKPVFAHPSNMEGIEIAIQSGVDALAHTAPLSGRWSNDLMSRMKANHIALVPTLTLFEVEGKKFGESAEDVRDEMETASQQLKGYLDAGGQILFGTDVGYTDYFDTTEEFKLMGNAGLTFQQILASLTSNPAERFGGAKNYGRVDENMIADLVVLERDPAEEVTAFARVRYTIARGQVLYDAKQHVAESKKTGK